MSQARQVTVSLFNIDKTPIVNARIEIRLVSMGVADDGFIAPHTIEKNTDETGQAVFTLWQNSGHQRSYYEVRSWHPSGSVIHRSERFWVGGADSDLDDLINAGFTPGIDPGGNTNPVISAQAVVVFAGETGVVMLGPEVDGDQDAVFYSVVPGADVRVFGNLAEITSLQPGNTTKTVTAIDGRGGRATAQLSVTSLDPQLYDTFELQGVVVQ